MVCNWFSDGDVGGILIVVVFFWREVWGWVKDVGKYGRDVLDFGCRG